MGRSKHLEEVKRLFEKSPVVEADSILRLINSKKKVGQYSKQLIRYLILKGKIKKLAKGCYTIHNEISLAAFCFKPSYLGLQDALSIHNLWEQETIPVIITTRKARPGIRKIMGANALIRRIDKRYFFGFEYMDCGGFYIPVSDVEKTFIDMVYFNEKLDEQLLSGIRREINKKTLENYLKKYPQRFREKIRKITN